ncbi:hypothetical protein LZ30DRAFT_689933 [Colletotrichum cereale]|nr:hypothetical protein LZ30DRAFT_689933 [Colletotrichum cereale]
MDIKPGIEAVKKAGKTFIVLYKIFISKALLIIAKVFSHSGSSLLRVRMMARRISKGRCRQRQSCCYRLALAKGKRLQKVRVFRLQRQGLSKAVFRRAARMGLEA